MRTWQKLFAPMFGGPSEVCFFSDEIQLYITGTSAYEPDCWTDNRVVYHWMGTQQQVGRGLSQPGYALSLEQARADAEAWAEALR